MLTQIAWSDPESYPESRNQLGFNQPTVCLFETRSNGNLCKYFVRLPWFLYILNWQNNNYEDVYIQSCNVKSPCAFLYSFSRVLHRWDFTLEIFSDSVYHELWCKTRLTELTFPAIQIRDWKCIRGNPALNTWRENLVNKALVYVHSSKCKRLNLITAFLEALSCNVAEGYINHVWIVNTNLRLEGRSLIFYHKVSRNPEVVMVIFSEVLHLFFQFT